MGQTGATTPGPKPNNGIAEAALYSITVPKSRARQRPALLPSFAFSKHGVMSYFLLLDGSCAIAIVYTVVCNVPGPTPIPLVQNGMAADCDFPGSANDPMCFRVLPNPIFSHNTEPHKLKQYSIKR
jgi:hypothetical protein